MMEYQRTAADPGTHIRESPEKIAAHPADRPGQIRRTGDSVETDDLALRVRVQDPAAERPLPRAEFHDALASGVPRAQGSEDPPAVPKKPVDQLQVVPASRSPRISRIHMVENFLGERAVHGQGKSIMSENFRDVALRFIVRRAWGCLGSKEMRQLDASATLASHEQHYS